MVNYQIKLVLRPKLVLISSSYPKNVKSPSVWNTKSVTVRCSKCVIKALSVMLSAIIIANEEKYWSKISAIEQVEKYCNTATNTEI